MRSLLFLPSILVLPLLGCGPALAGENEEAEPPPLRVRAVDAGFLVHGRTDQLACTPPGRTPGLASGDERPLFGAEAEEAILPLGTVDELIERIKNAVEPAHWERREGADIRSDGVHRLVLKAERRVLDAVAGFLRGLEHRVGRMVTVDVQAVRLARPEAVDLRRSGIDDDHVRELLQGPRAGPSVSLTAFAGQRAAAFGGTQRAGLRALETNVAKESAITDPQVEVANLGLAVDAVSVPVPGESRMVVGLDAFLSGLAGTRQVDTGETGTLEVPAYAVTRLHTAAVLRDGAWTLVDGAGGEVGEAGWYLLLRATVLEAPAPSEAVAGFDLPVLPHIRVREVDRTALVVRHHPVHALCTWASPRRGEGSFLTPSRYAPPEPPELPDPLPLLPIESLVEWIFEASGDEAWEDPAAMEIRNETLVVRHVPEMQDAVAGLLAAMRRHYLPPFTVTAELFEVDGAPAHPPATAQSLAAAVEAGAARRLDVTRLTARAGVRSTVRAGRDVAYVCDYDPEVAESAAILDPVPAAYLDGVELDAEVVPSCDGRTAHLVLRYLRTHPAGPSRTWSAPGGGGATVDLPELGVERVRLDLAVALGRGTVAAAWGDGARHRVLVVTVAR